MWGLLLTIFELYYIIYIINLYFLLFLPLPLLVEWVCTCVGPLYLSCLCYIKLKSTFLTIPTTTKWVCICVGPLRNITCITLFLPTFYTVFLLLFFHFFQFHLVECVPMWGLSNLDYNITNVCVCVCVLHFYIVQMYSTYKTIIFKINYRVVFLLTKTKHTGRRIWQFKLVCASGI